MKKDHTLLVATDRKLINAEGHVYCDSVRHRQSRPWEQWHTYDDIGVKNFFATCAPGMCLMAEGDFVRQTVPFSTETGHDKWIIACACACGQVSFLDEPLSFYRRYGKNVSGIMKGISTKEEYKQQRILPHFRLIEEFQQKYPQYPGTQTALTFARARAKGNMLGMLRGWKINPDLVAFECVLSLLPAAVANRLIHFLKTRAQ